MKDWPDLSETELDKHFDEAVRMRDQWQERIDVIQQERKRRTKAEIDALRAQKAKQ